MFYRNDTRHWQRKFMWFNIENVHFLSNTSQNTVYTL